MPWLSWNSLRVIACRVVKITTFQSTTESTASDFSPVKNSAKVDRFKYFIVFSYLQKHQPYDLEGFLRLKICKSPTLVSLHFSRSLGGCFWIVRKSEPNRLLKTLRSLSVYMLKSFFFYHRNNHVKMFKTQVERRVAGEFVLSTGLHWPQNQ